MATAGPPAARTAAARRSSPPHGMVAASQPLAAQVGIDILKAGGNAIDAAVAVNAMLGLVEPHMNGVGGDLFALVWDAETERLYGLNGDGPRAVRDQPRDAGPAGLRAHAGQRAADVDGARRGRRLARAAGALRDDGAGRRPRAGHRLRARRLPRERDHPGTVDRRGARTGRVARLRGHLPAGRPPRRASGRCSGTRGSPPPTRPLPREAAMPSTRATSRAASSPSARRTAATSRWPTSRTTRRPGWRPVSTSYRGYDVWEVPPNSSGILALMILNIMEGIRRRRARPQLRRGDPPLRRGEEAGLGRPQHLRRGRRRQRAADGGARLQGLRGRPAQADRPRARVHRSDARAALRAQRHGLP